jgi:hypothetical protein
MIAGAEELRKPPAIASRIAVLGFAIAAIACVLYYEALATSGQPTVAVIWAGVALATYIVALLCLTGASNGVGIGIVRWKIGPWMLLWYAVTFGLATVTWSQPQTGGVTGEIAVPSVLRAVWMLTVGISAWFVGYMAGPGQLVMHAGHRAVRALGNRFTGEVRSLAAPWILYAIGIAARLLTAASTGIFGYVGNASSAVSTASGYQGMLGALALCAPLGVAAAALQVFRDSTKGARITLTVLFLTEVGFGVAAGNKENFVIAVLAVIISFGAAHRRLPRIAITGVIITFLVVVIPFNQSYRSAVRQGTVTLTPSQGVATAPTILKETLTNGDMAGVVVDSLDYMTQRIREIDNVAIVVQRAPAQVPFASPLQLIEQPVIGMIPRAVWPGKPILATGYQFGQIFYELPPSVYTSTPDTMAGGLYWHGGWISVIFGMALFGAAVRLLDNILDVRTNPHAILLVLLLFPTLIGGETDWSALLGTVPAILFVWLVSIAILFRPKWRI